MTRARLAGLGAALFVAGLLLGHWTHPQPAKLTDSAKAASRQDDHQALSLREDKAVDVKAEIYRGPEHKIIRRFRKTPPGAPPGCQVAEELEIDRGPSVAKSEAVAQAHAAEAKVDDHHEALTIEHTVTVVNRPRVLFSALLGTNRLALEAPPVQIASVQLHVFAGCYAGPWGGRIDGAPAAGAAATCAW